MFNFQDAMAKSLASSGLMSQMNQKALEGQKGYAFQMPGSANTQAMAPIIMQAPQMPSAPNITYTLNQPQAAAPAPVTLPTPAPATYNIQMPSAPSALHEQPAGPDPYETPQAPAQTPAPAQQQQQPEFNPNPGGYQGNLGAYSQPGFQPWQQQFSTPQYIPGMYG